MPTIGLMERIAQAPMMCDGAMKTQLVERGFNRGLIPDKETSFSTGTGTSITPTWLKRFIEIIWTLVPS